MTSRVAWLDASADEQRRVREVVQLFAQRETLDEMGGRRIVIALSDTLFPGTSQLHSRARYVLFIPWLCQIAASKKDRLGWLDWLERRLITSFLDTDGIDAAGLVGLDAGPAVKQLPSSMYWTALQSWGVHAWPGTIDETLERMARGGRSGRAGGADVGDLDELAERQPSVWHPGVGRPPPGFPEDPAGGFALTPEEAEWLRERWLATTDGSLLAHLVRRAQPLTDEAWAPWLDSACRTATGPICATLDDAERFGLAVDGARMLYNLLVAERYVERGYTAADADLGAYRDRIDGWAAEVHDRASLFDGWEPRDFWAFVRGRNARVDEFSRRFFDVWFDHLSRQEVDRVADDERLRGLCAERERFLKRGQARLANDKLLAAWRGGSTGRAVYRWHQVQVLVGDVLDGMGVDRAGA